jgi:hypothetical protein
VKQWSEAQRAARENWTEEQRAAARESGRRGGSVRSPKQAEAAMRNLERAQEARARAGRPPVWQRERIATPALLEALGVLVDTGVSDIVVCAEEPGIWRVSYKLDRRIGG